MNLVDERLLLVSPNSQQIMGKITGDTDSETILVFVHGFGVKSDSRMMFTDLVESFKDKFLTVRFHLVRIDTIKNEIHTPGFDEQTLALKTVIDSLVNQYPKKKIIVIAHSQGCYIIGNLVMKSNYSFEKIILLSPLIRKDLVKKVIEHFQKREGSIIDFDGESRFSRTDGSTTIITKSFWSQLKDFNSLEVFKTLNEKHSAYFVWSSLDCIERKEEYENLLELSPKNYKLIEGNHEYRVNGNIDELTKFLKTIL